MTSFTSDANSVVLVYPDRIIFDDAKGKRREIPQAVFDKWKSEQIIQHVNTTELYDQMFDVYAVVKEIEYSYLLKCLREAAREE